MSPEWTPGATRRLESYLANARRTLAAQRSVDAEEVVQDVRAHVEAELRDAPDPVTADAVERVLASLGSTGDWLELERGQAGGFVHEWGGPIAVFTIFVASIPMFAFGPYVLVLSAIVARAVAEHQGESRLVGAKRWLLLPPIVVVGIALAAATFVAPFFPAAEVTLRSTQGVFNARVVSILGSVMGAWWTVIGVVLYLARRPVAWLMWPLHIDVAGAGRLLGGLGGSVLLVAGVTFVLSR